MGMFWGLITRFDSTMQEDVKRVRNKDAHAHYLWPHTQNDRISIMAFRVLKKKVLPWHKES